MIKVSVRDRHNKDIGLYQWDKGRTIKIYDVFVDSPIIEFVSGDMKESLWVEPIRNESGIIEVKIPNVLLESAAAITVYISSNENGATKTRHIISLPVVGRVKPSGYVYEACINPEWTDWRYFDYCGNRDSLVAKLKYSDTSNGTTFSFMFYESRNLTTIPLIDTSNGTDFSNMFQYCSSLTTIPLINTSKGTDFNRMFQYCRNLTTIPLIDTSNGNSFSYMFQSCAALAEIPELDTSKGTYFSYMFNGCSALQTIHKLNLSGMPSSSNMSGMFYGCSALENVTFEGTIKITSNISVFSDCPNLTVDSLMSFINALSDNTSLSTTYTVTIGSTNLAKLTQEQIDIATAKNITLA